MATIDAAARIVTINAVLAEKMANEKRAQLTAEQRNLWDAHMPGYSFDTIERISRH